MGKFFAAPPNRVEVRFAIDKKAVACDTFSIQVDQQGRSLIAGKFSSNVELSSIEPNNSKLPLAVTIDCAGYIWHFDRVPTGMLQRGWWFVGTDYPPFQPEFSCPRFASFRLIRYVQFVGQGGNELTYYEIVPRSNTESEVCSK